MKKSLLTLCMAAASFAASAGIEVVFNGTDHAGWEVQGLQTIKDGHAQVQMIDQGTSFRADVKFAKSETATLTLDPSVDKILAIKFIGERPQGRFKMEFNDGEWHNKVWDSGNPDGSVATTGGNMIYYFDLSRDENFQVGTRNIDKLNIIIADCTVEPHAYTLDWIRTFDSADDVKDAKDWKDDGASDLDEDVVVTMPVVNTTTNTGYAALTEAWNMAADGDVLEISKNQIVSTRLNSDGRTITLKKAADAEGDVNIARATDFKGIMFLTNKKEEGEGEDMVTTYATLNIEGLIINGSNAEGTTPFEASQNGTLNLTDVKITQTNSNNGQGVISIKGGGHVNLNNVLIEKSTLIEGACEIFYGINCSLNMKGNTSASVLMEQNTVIEASELTNTTPITLTFATDRDLVNNAVIVRGWDKPANFRIANDGYTVEADGEGNLKIVEGEDPVTPPVGAVENVEAASNAPVEYYNLQGVRVENPANGLYIRRQGANVTKVYVK